MSIKTLVATVAVTALLSAGFALTQMKRGGTPRQQDLLGLGAGIYVDKSQAKEYAKALHTNPKLTKARLRANENEAASNLRKIANAQKIAKVDVAIDTDGDGIGEFGFLAELAGMKNVRGATRRLDQEYLARAFAKVKDGGICKWRGYLYRVQLPSDPTDGTVTPVFEASGGGWDPAGTPVSSDQSEEFWSIYAWPEKAGVTGERAFYMDQRHVLLETENAGARYDGAAAAPAFDAALAAAQPGDMTAETGLDEPDTNDGQAWTKVR